MHPGNFGTRAKHIIKALEAQNKEFFCISRMGLKNSPNYKNLVLFSIYARIANGVRTKIAPWWNNRILERKIFELYVKSYYRNADVAQDIVHLWEHSPVLIDFFQRKGARVVLEVPSVPMNFVRNLKSEGKGKGLQYFRNQEKIEQISIKKADCIISPSSFVSKYIRQIETVSMLFTIPFGFPKPCNLNLQKNHSKPLNVLYAGNVDYRKGFSELTAIMHLLERENILLNVVGKKGKAYYDLRHKLPKNIKVHSFQNLDNFYREADVFLFPSWCEGSAKVTYEAMAYGCAVLTTQYAGSLVKNNHTGFILSPENIEDWVDKLRFLMLNKAFLLKMQSNAVHFSSQRDWKIYSQDVLEVYEKIS